MPSTPAHPPAPDHDGRSPGDVLRYAVGANTRRFRLARGMSLRELAERAAVSPAQLSQVERGLANPTLDVLVRLAGALDVAFEALTRNVAERPVVIRAGHGPQWIGQGAADTSIITELFSHSGSRFDVRHTRLPAGCVTSETSHGVGTMEHAIVMSGDIEVRGSIAGHTDSWSETLHTGDAIAFAADTNHSYRTHDREAQMIVIVAFPENWLPPEQQPTRSLSSVEDPDS
ncbi:helix-turn-helix domain-containing protein [Gordonia jinhuaensis]|uniref:helix-turn-helix domain-containing protein n=1 Tax=Gordonia jinhuaensis TaxID=1517702 RepID=UPI00166603E7|nr:XRE family transcriptional regulator [Gordonia jinhuaensis]